MTCETYQDLLDQLMDGTISTEDEKKLLAHEAECPGCAELHAAMLSLQDDLQTLADDVPPLPEDFHAGWASKLVSQTQKSSTPHKILLTPAVQRVLAACAVFAIVLGGTILSRNAFHPRNNESTDQAPLLMESKHASSSELSSAGLGTVNSFSSESAVLEEEIEAYAAESAFDAVLEAAPSVPSEQKIMIRSATVLMKSKAMDEALSRLETLCTSIGGSLSVVSSQTESGISRQNLLEVTMPVENFSSFLSELQGLDGVIQCEEADDDVTAAYQDVRQQLDTQLALQEHLKSSLQEASSSGQETQERQLADIQKQIDQLRASLSRMDSSAATGTVYITITEE
ncbi:MAG: DUF4349 domain-containing protein [Clostridia bacterium]|nr:DUF4349 domain-containing protein [Clostridia bacterium]